jgi:hypothetical protein
MCNSLRPKTGRPIAAVTVASTTDELHTDGATTDNSVQFQPADAGALTGMSAAIAGPCTSDASAADQSTDFFMIASLLNSFPMVGRMIALWTRRSR